MIPEYFGFKHLPFKLDDVAFLQATDLGKQIICEQIIHDLQKGVTPILLIGDLGPGKSQLMQYLLALIPPNIELITPLESGLSFATKVLMGIDQLPQETQDNKKLLLLIDDADVAPDTDLKLLLLLAKQHAEKHPQFQMIWFGTKGLDEKLSRIDTRNYSRYPYTYYLDGMDYTQVKHYINSELELAGYLFAERGDLFTPDAIKKIAELSCGNPLLINKICNEALQLAQHDARLKISERHILEASKTCLTPNPTAGRQAPMTDDMDAGLDKPLTHKISIRITTSNPASVQQHAPPLAFTPANNERKLLAACMVIGLCIAALAGRQFLAPPSDMANTETDPPPLSVTPTAMPATVQPVVKYPIGMTSYTDNQSLFASAHASLTHGVNLNNPYATSVQQIKPQKPHFQMASSQSLISKTLPTHPKPTLALQQISQQNQSGPKHLPTSLLKQVKPAKPRIVTARYTKQGEADKSAVQLAGLAKQHIEIPNHTAGIANTKKNLPRSWQKPHAQTYIVDAQEAAARDRAASRRNLDRMGVEFSPEALISAAGKGDLQATKLLIAAGIPANIKNHQGETALMASAKNGHKHIVHELLKKHMHNQL